MYLYFLYLSTYNNSGFVFVSVWLNYPPLLNSMLYFTSHYLLTLLLALKILKIFIKIFISLFKNIFTQGLFSKFPRMTRPFFHKSFLPQGLISTRSFLGLFSRIQKHTYPIIYLVADVAGDIVSSHFKYSNCV